MEIPKVGMHTVQVCSDYSQGSDTEVAKALSEKLPNETTS